MRHTGSNKSKVTPHNYSYKNKSNAKLRNVLPNDNIKGAYWIIKRFLVHYQILHLSNIAIAILDFSLLLPIK